MKKSSREIILFTGDNVFSAIMVSKLCTDKNISKIIVSHATTKSWYKLWKIFKTSSFHYFVYRSFIQLVSSLAAISRVAETHRADVKYIQDKEEFLLLADELQPLAIACNFDMIIPQHYIDSRSIGVLNAHASDLPRDRGISPAVWAFSRGDNRIYVSFYFMDGGIDTGEVVAKGCLDVKPEWSLFRTYCEVMTYAAQMMSEIIPMVLKGSENSNAASENTDASPSYNSWPNKDLHRLMRKNNKRYFKTSDLLYLRKILKRLRS